MNIEIKFRYVYKNIKTNEILLMFYNLKDIEDSTASLDKDRLWNEGYSLINRDLYTGFKDKNGKLIYERDIVKYGYENCWGKFYYNYSIQGNMENGYFELVNKKENSKKLTERKIRKRNIEIIGSIYNNSELLDRDKIF